MKIGNMGEFMAGQADKVRRRKEEEKRIKKGIYQMHVMVEGECLETLTEEQKKAESKKESTKAEKESTSDGQKEEKSTDIQAEIEKLLSMGSKHYKTIIGKE